MEIYKKGVWGSFEHSFEVLSFKKRFKKKLNVSDQHPQPLQLLFMLADTRTYNPYNHFPDFNNQNQQPLQPMFWVAVTTTIHH